MANRPTGVTIICILSWVGSVISMLAGAGVVLAGALLSSGLAGVFGAIILVIGIVDFIVTFWLWQMKKLGWTLVMALNVFSIIISAVSLNIFGLIFPVIVVIYLWMKKDLFK